MTTANLFGSAIRRYCETQCPSAGSPLTAQRCVAKACALWTSRLDRQVQLFDADYRRWWFEVADAYVDRMPTPFWVSQYRARFDLGINLPGPARREWWGTLTRRWLRRGYVMTGRSRSSPTPSLNGSREQEWARGERWKAYEGPGTGHPEELLAKSKDYVAPPHAWPEAKGVAA